MTTPNFRTFDVSGPLPGVPGLRFATIGSPALGRRADMSLYVPPGDKPLPLVILLHGVYGSHWNWAFHGHAPGILDDLLKRQETRPVALAMPSDGLWGDGSAYLPRAENSEAFIVHEVARAARLMDERVTGPVYVAGLSMGGFGAVRLGFLHPDTFAAAAGMSSVTSIRNLITFTEQEARDYPAPPGTASLLEVITNAPRRIPLRLDCGTEDHLLASNRELHAALDAAGVEHEYAEFPGGHTWDYWSARLPGILRFFDRLR